MVLVLKTNVFNSTVGSNPTLSGEITQLMLLNSYFLKFRMVFS